MSRFSLRTRLTILVTVAAAITLAVLTAGFNLLLRSNLDADANRVLQARASGGARGDLRAGRLAARQGGPDRAAPDAQVWVYSGKTAVERPAGAAVAPAAADSLAGGPGPRRGLRRRTYASTRSPSPQGGKRVGTVVSAISLEPYEHSASRALTASLIFAAAACCWSCRRPAGRHPRPATRRADDRGGGGLERARPRPPLRRRRAPRRAHPARRDLRQHARPPRLEPPPRAALSAELSHELRTPLAAIVTEAELALRRDRSDEEYREALREIASRASQMQRTLETLMAAARAEATGIAARRAAEVGARAIEAATASRGTTAWI